MNIQPFTVSIPSSSCGTNGPSLHSKITLPDSNELMPHILRNVNPIVVTLLTQHHIFNDRAIIIVSSHSNLASQDNERLILRWMPMNGNLSPWLHSIQETDGTCLPATGGSPMPRSHPIRPITQPVYLPPPWVHKARL